MDRFYLDVQAQMGRVASGCLGKRTSLLIAAIAMRKAMQELKRRRARRTPPHILTQWIEQGAENNLEQLLTLLFLVFQEDMLQLAVGNEAQSIVKNIEKTVVCETLDVELRTKPESSLPFSRTLGFIGA